MYQATEHLYGQRLHTCSYNLRWHCLQDLCLCDSAIGLSVNGHKSLIRALFDTYHIRNIDRRHSLQRSRQRRWVKTNGIIAQYSIEPNLYQITVNAYIAPSKSPLNQTPRSLDALLHLSDVEFDMTLHLEIFVVSGMDFVLDIVLEFRHLFLGLLDADTPPLHLTTFFAPFFCQL
jgi:hypothetical protein